MKTKTLKCTRCGKEYQLTVGSVSEFLECSHCHRKYVISSKSRGRLTLVRYVAIMAIIIPIFLGFQDVFNKNMLLWLLLVFTLSLILTFFADKFCMKLTFLIFGLEYVEYVEQPKVIEKPKKKEKFSLFKRKDKK